MAKIFPNVENIKRLKVSPTEGEWALLNFLLNKFSDDIEIYFQPFLNGDRPDIILMQKNVGVSIIEVKDWNLDSYEVTENNKWYVKSINQIIKSPFKQVFAYKDNLFNLHINGLLKEKIKNKNFYGRIKPFVYFHKSTKNGIKSFYSTSLNALREKEQNVQSKFKLKEITYESYENQLNYLKMKKKKIERDIAFYSVGKNDLEKIVLPSNSSNIFNDLIYDEFNRYLKPPVHTIEEGIDIKYTKKQEKLIVSIPEQKKIKGVAGSGKTVTLAKRAVNAHKRHSKQVLILTFNITLRSYIHDKISDVRENFNWSNFYITNYHQLITQELNNLGIVLEIPDEIQDKSNYLDTHYYSNIKLYDEYTNDIKKYDTILIDEIQDYKVDWVKIIRKHFLVENAEIVVFGDEKQNIYDRELDEDKSPNLRIQGFGRWEKLNKSIRHMSDGNRIISLAKKFQFNFFKDKYELDEYENDINTQGALSLDIYKVSTYIKDRLSLMVEKIFEEIRSYNIHQNEATILCSNINLIREVDYIIRSQFNFKTLTTFETKEMYESKNRDISIDEIRKNKKIAFNLNNGMIKVATTYSFKGYESPTIFLIIDDKDSAEIIYAGLTRSKFNLMIFHTEESEYSSFFDNELERVL